MSTHHPLTFSAEKDSPFFQVLKSRITPYLQASPQGRAGGNRLLRKALVCLAILLVPYALLLGLPMPGWLQLVLCVVMGTGMALLGLNVMHEACHHTFSPHRRLNALASLVTYLLGADKLVWQTSHNVLHHRYTNIPGHDIDLEAGNGILRFGPETPWRPIHRWQHLYAFGLYSLLTLTWVLLTDFVKLRKFERRKLAYKNQHNFRLNWLRLIAFKLAAYAFWLGMPILVMDQPVWQLLLGFLVMHLVAGLMLTLIFQLAHLTPVNAMPVPDQAGSMAHGWAGHQLYTTANWAMDSPWLNWVCGGLNYQIEHHLFPYLSHLHYPAIAPIVRQTAVEHGLPYYAYHTLGEALAAHYAHLRAMGQPPDLATGPGETPRTPG